MLPVLFVGMYLIGMFELQSGESLPLSGQLLWLGVGASCIVGHMFSVYLGFRGGKGVATSLGVVLGVWPYFTLTGVLVLVIWVVVWAVWRYVSLASILASVAFPIVLAGMIWYRPQWEFSNLVPLFGFSCLMALLVIVRHRSNISRLLAGTENRGGRHVEQR